jgi:hypothetical protein
MGDAQVDEARFFATGDDLNREAERGARFAQELGRIFRHAQGVGADCAHCAARQAAQPFADALQRLQRASLRGAVDAFLGGQAGAQAHHFAQ